MKKLITFKYFVTIFFIVKKEIYQIDKSFLIYKNIKEEVVV